MKEDASHQVFLGYGSLNQLQRQTPSPPPPQFPDKVEEMDGTGTKAEQRKSNKPVMEKRRRARINNCLNDLKGILLEAMRKDPARHSKLEKADILELTVRHLQNVQRNQLAIAMASDPTVLQRFKNGFSEGATEVSRYLGRLDIGDPGIKTRMSTHLNGCINGLQQINTGPALTHPTQLTAAYPAPPVPPVPPISFGPLPSRCPQTSSITLNNSPGTKKNERFHPVHAHASDTPPQASFGSAFTLVPSASSSFIASPMSTTSNDTLSTSLSTGSDSSSLSFSSDKGINTSPIDFSLKHPSPSAPRNHAIRVVKVVPMGKQMNPLTIDKGHMWRPW